MLRTRSRQFDMRTTPFSKLRAFMEEFCSAAAVSKQAENNLVLIVDELSANSMEHGYSLLPAPTAAWPVWLTLALTGKGIEALYEDAAWAHNPFQHIDPPDYSGPPETWRIGGWGVPIISRIACNLRYDYRNGRNRVHFALPANRCSHEEVAQDKSSLSL